LCACGKGGKASDGGTGSSKGQVEVAAAVDVARAVAGELEALHDSSTSSSVSTVGGTADELKRAREAAREYVVQWEAVQP
jgi:hypothetical protein